jgi:hypothetical protein
MMVGCWSILRRSETTSFNKLVDLTGFGAFAGMTNRDRKESFDGEL